MKTIAVIPAHLASVRFPNKILHKFHGLPMIEHVRRRALLSKHINEVYVATCDEKIAKTIIDYGGQVILTSNKHKNGTSRVAESIKDINCSHVILLQGDEPLLLPKHVDKVAEEIANNPRIESWNATGPIENPEELDRHSFVKCIVSEKGDILYCFRRSPCYSDFKKQRSFTRKILGIIAYKKEFLLKLTSLNESPIESVEFIEQMRIIENNFRLKSVPINTSLPSVNEPHEANIVMDYIESSDEQKNILNRIIHDYK
jgi:3-deoxy-manno-octulosonate cytidylyltransferase (CMP-KDO synthetase)